MRLGPADIPGLVELERLCFAVPWNAKQYRTVMDNPPFRVFGLHHDEGLAAYLTLFASDFEMEILNIAVRPDLRRMGLGRRMLAHVLQLCRKMGIQRGYLEVRRSNAAARRLYEAFGFEEVGVRKGYYPDNREDAIVMRLEFETGQPG
ncbi:ribosomal protein S18-alanine N-acetyltransferase [Fundidesulfovibrio magnetotacticus]|uniref:ribosomal protein S18-alanine N-acetyltransferase n=1 Tax=Fundidesulfovibrio magnetotacticus TaxID=2730080 RepID=UPI0015673B6B|nr:ribosomal protein S18-alanine N-acetyltransferase [Fundidesulfovibrio magnetotacticus]